MQEPTKKVKVKNEEGSPNWWREKMVKVTKQLLRNPDDKNLANVSSKLAYNALVSNQIDKMLQDRAELDDLRQKVQDILKFRNKETII